MDTAGEPPANRVKRTNRGRRSSAAQENQRDQRNEWYFRGSFAFARLAQNYGTTETERGICGTGETPQDGWKGE